MKKNRENEILNLLIQNKKMEVVELSNLLGVSQVTIRKDLDALEEKHLVKRIHGYAQLNSDDDINGRLVYHYDAKMKIALKALELVKDGDTIMIESGSCCALLALQVAKLRHHVTIITNSAFIGEYVRNEPNVQVILLGGIYQKDSQCLVGPMIVDSIKNYHVDYFFVGTDGYSEQIGFTNKDLLRAQAVRDMSSSSNHIVVITESEKFTHIGIVPLSIDPKKCILVTDSNLNSSIQKNLEEKQIEVKIA